MQKLAGLVTPNKYKGGSKQQGGNKAERKRFEKPKWMLIAPKQG